jgi:hypothetical protein
MERHRILKRFYFKQVHFGVYWSILPSLVSFLYACIFLKHHVMVNFINCYNGLIRVNPQAGCVADRLLVSSTVKEIQDVTRYNGYKRKNASVLLVKEIKSKFLSVSCSVL